MCGLEGSIVPRQSMAQKEHRRVPAHGQHQTALVGPGHDPANMNTNKERVCLLLLLLQPLLLLPVLDVRIVMSPIGADILGASVDVLPSNTC